MKNAHRGSAAIAVLIAFLVLLGGLAAIAGISWYSAAKTGNEMEQGVKYAHRDLNQILGQYSIKVQEAAKVPEKYQARLEQTLTSVMTARMGEGGMQADWAWLQEAGVPYDASMDRQLSQIIEAGRTKFENQQTIFLDKKRAYDTALGSPWQGLWLSVAGFPKIDLDAYDVVTSAHSDESFRTGQDKAVAF